METPRLHTAPATRLFTAAAIALWLPLWCCCATLAAGDEPPGEPGPSCPVSGERGCGSEQDPRPGSEEPDPCDDQACQCPQATAMATSQATAAVAPPLASEFELAGLDHAAPLPLTMAPATFFALNSGPSPAERPGDDRAHTLLAQSCLLTL